MPIKIYRVSAISLAVSIALGVTGCGGGGGGGGGGYVNRDVPFYTPVRVDAIKPVNTSQNVADSSSLFAANISSSSGAQDLILAGRQTPDGGAYNTFNMQIWSWSNGTLINKTSQWFSGTDNRIVGTEPSVKFADFDNDGRKDIYVAPNTDTGVYGPGVVFFNNGTNFTRVNLNLGDIPGHDSAVYDLNGDGYMDIVTLGMRVSFGGPGRTFTTYVGTGDYPGAGGGIAIADFLNNGTSTMLLTDMNNGQVNNNRLYSWSMGVDGVYLTQIANLPTSRFLLPKWAGYGFSGSHDYRVLAFDFDNSGKTSAVVFSRPKSNDPATPWPAYSEIQFNKNQGGGVFIDVTDNVLVGYNTRTPANYTPTLTDVNGDGLVDILLTATSWDDNNGAQVLIHTKEHKYVASYATVLKAFADQALDLEKRINAATLYGANGIVFVQGPDNQMYLATAVTYVDGGVQKKAIYLSKLGNMTASAQATADAIKQAWPWMSPGQVNTVLAQSSTTWFGLNLLDPAKALAPIGDLKIPGMSGMLSINGAVSGLRLGSAANQIKVQDSLGRDFNVNYSMTSYMSNNSWLRAAEYMHNSDTRSAQFTYNSLYQYGNLRYTDTNDPRNAAVGITGINLGSGMTLGVQYTRLPFNPFVNLSGSWGSVISSGTMETSLAYRSQGLVAKGGIMYTGTEIRPGLVNRINPITSIWAETGYEFGRFKLYGGMLPKAISGSADITLPTGIDSQGRITYTSTRVGLESATVEYARFAWDDRINKRTSYRLTGMQTTQNQKHLMATLKYDF